MDVSKRAQELIHVQFDLEGRHRLLEFGVVATGAVHCFRYIFKYKVEVDLVFLER